MSRPPADVDARAAAARPRRAWPRRVALATVATLAAAAVLAAFLAVWSVRRPFPQTAGTAGLAALDAPVQVHRDEAGVPTIVAATSRDLHRALGYVHAQDRFWQMDAWRHVGRGRTAELFGSSQLPTDRFLRTLGWERVAETELDLLAPATRRILHDYADGVNAYLDGRAHRELALEYTVLALDNRDYRPRPWDPVDTLVFLKLMAWDLRSNLDAEIERAVLAQTLSRRELADLYPPFDAAPVVVPDYGPAGAAVAGARLPPLVTLLEEVGAAVAAVPSPSPPGESGVGSNAWVIGGEHTDTGKPMLANDPHLGIQMPSIWHQVSLRCAAGADRDACDHDVAGFTFAGVPGVVVGHNGALAWGVTNLGADVMDLFVERINPDDPHQYEVDGEWVDMEVTTETLRSAGGATEELEIRRTRNGPIVSGVYGPLDELDAGGEYALALRWTALEPRPMLDTLPRLNRAGSVEELREALGSFFVPGQNVVYAGADGSIGYQATGVVPIRGDGDGRLPAPGWVDAYQWTGFVAYDDLPHLHDPDEGWIVTANNPVVGDEYPYLLGSDWDHGQRAARLIALLGDADRPITLDDVQAQQTDTYQHAADWLVPALLSIDVDDDAERVAGAVRVLEQWDRRMDAGSAGAAVFAATWRHLLAHMFHARLPERYRPAGNARWFEVVRRLMDRPDDAWWDDPSTPAPETRDDAFAAALRAATAELHDRLGGEPADWAWGSIHSATFRHQTLGESGIALVEDRFNRGGYPAAGSSSIVNAVGWHAAAGYEVTWLPSLRMIVDLDDPDRSRAIHTTGQSGHAYHPDYTSMIEPWLAGDLRPMRWQLAPIADEAAGTLRLEP